MDQAFKKKVLQEIIRRKNDELELLKADQQSQWESATDEDIDQRHIVESPREQMMEEIELKARTADQLADELARLQAIDPDEAHDAVALGALVRTNTGYFQVGAAHPAFEIDSQRVIGVSPQAPFFQKTKGLQKGEEFHLGNIEYVILDIW